MIRLFITGFFQVFLVVLNTYFISNRYVLGIGICGFLISYIWSYNVKKIAFGNFNERVVYCTGAMLGSVLAYYFGGLIV